MNKVNNDKRTENEVPSGLPMKGIGLVR